MNTFPHDSNARNDERIVRLRMTHGAAGYGVYFMLLERMRDNDTHGFTLEANYSAIAFDLNVPADLVRAVVCDFDLFRLSDDGRTFYSPSFLERMQRMQSVSRARSEAGRRGGRPRKLPTPPYDVSQAEIPFPDAATAATIRPGQSPDELEPLYLSPLLTPSPISSSICTRYSITMLMLNKHVSDFIIDCRCRNKQHRSQQDAIAHFNDWLRIAITKSTPTNDTDKSKAANRRSGTVSVSAPIEDYSAKF